MSRFNFKNITLQDKADITEVMNNFKKVEEQGLILDDLAKQFRVTLSRNSWTANGTFYEYRISNNLIKPEPYNINVYFTDLSLIKSAILPKTNSQAEGSITLRTAQRPATDLVADIVITKVVV